jgi:hypothetical protein
VAASEIGVCAIFLSDGLRKQRLIKQDQADHRTAAFVLAAAIGNI